jgi:hypothetical protein
MKRFLIALNLLFTLPCFAILNAPLTIQEALYPGSVAGVARTNEPFCMGVPVADSATITSTGVLTLSGATAGQFRILGKWPSGNAKWIKVCGILPSLGAGSTAAVTLTDGGSGNFGGSDLATDNGSTITVNTGAATFSIKKANFNVIDSVVIGGTTVVASSTTQTRGLVLTGPDPTAALPGNVTCSPEANGTACTTIYSSANDANSSCSIEESGPVMTVVRCIGTHKDANGNPYMQFTAREYFYQGKTNVKVTAVLRNANYDTSTAPSPDCNYSTQTNTCRGGTFNIAFKGIKSYELRIASNISGTLNYTIATDTTPQTGTLSAGDSAYIYQGYSEWLTAMTVDNGYCNDQTAGLTATCIVSYTTDVGYIAKKNTTPLASGDQSKAIGGWADIADSNGVGIEIGIDQMSAMWPASLEFNSGGSDVRIGLFSGHNSKNVYMPWPYWKVFETYLNFHSTNPTSLSQSFLAFQHPLLARPPNAYTNATGVFPYPIADPVTEDNYYVNTGAAANPSLSPYLFCLSGGPTNCTPDRGILNTNQQVQKGQGLGIVRVYPWSSGGSTNQDDYRWGDLLRFLQRGATGRFLNSRYFYRYLSEFYQFHADGTSATDPTVNGFMWKDRWHSNTETDAGGLPSPLFRVALNQMLGFGTYVDGAHSPQGPDGLHNHWYGMTDYYFLTGDEYFKEAIAAFKTMYLDQNTIVWGTSPTNTIGIIRGYGVLFKSSARLSIYAKAIGDTDDVLAIAIHNFDNYVNLQGCAGGIRPGQTSMTYYPAGCTPPNIPSFGHDAYGMSYERGLWQGNRGTAWCPAGDNTRSNTSGLIGDGYRIQQPFQNNIFVEGLLDLRRAKGPTWSNYNRVFDIAYGVTQTSFLETFLDDGQTHWRDSNFFFNGFAYDQPIDFASVCPTQTSTSDTRLLGPMSGTGRWITGRMYDKNSIANGSQGISILFWTMHQMTGALTSGSDLERKFKITLAQTSQGTSAWPGDFGMPAIWSNIYALNNPPSSKLQDVSFTVQDLGSGNYNLTFTTPAGTCASDPGCVRVKWSPKIIRPWNELLGFDSLNTNTFTYDPDVYATWFAANNVWPEPVATPGAQQSFTVSTGVTGLTIANFSVKANFPAASTGPAANLILVSGNNQSGTVGQPLANPFVVKVVDSNGNGVAGVMVVFAVTGGGGALSATVVGTDNLGMAAPTLTLGPAAGTNIVVASSGSLTGSPITFTATAGGTGTRPAANLVLVSGNNQSGTVGQPLANPFVVKVVDSNGSPVSGTNVTFAVTGGGGTVNPATVASNSQGLASTMLTLGPNAVSNTVTVSSVTLTGSPITFTATATTPAAGPATNLALVSGNNQSGTVGQPLANPFVVKVTDSNGNPVSGINVTFAATAGGGIVNPTAAVTNAQGLASTTLTLGLNAGTNTMTASSGTLAGSPLTFTATAAAVSSEQGSVTWTKQSQAAHLPGFLGWLVLPYDPVSQQMMLWSNTGGIYSSRMTFYNTSTNAFTAIAGSGSTGDACPPDLPNMPGDRHPDGQMAVDTKRNVLWIFGGANQTCGVGYANVNGTIVTLLTTQYANWTFPIGGQLLGQSISFSGGNSTIASVQDSMHLTLTSNLGSLTNTLFYVTTGTESNPRQDMYYLLLNADATQDIWHQVTPNHLPTPAQAASSAMIYDSDDDVLFAFGHIGNWVYCPTSGASVLTSAQKAAGCDPAAGGNGPDDWSRVNPSIQPPGSYFPQLVYDTLTKKVIQYGGICDSNTSTGCNETWAYDVPTHTWTQKALKTTPPPVYLGNQNNMGGTDEGSTTYNPVTHKVLYHQTTNTGAPADWQYDPAADTWSVLASVNAGPTGTQSFIGFDVSTNSLIAWTYNPSGTPDVWKGSMGGPLTAGPPTNLTLVSGNNQTGTVGQPLRNPFVARVTDANGIPVSGVAVTFAATGGGGSLNATTVTTDGQGLASCTLTLGITAGTNTVTASSGTLAGSPVTFTATGTSIGAGLAANLLLVSGNGQNGPTSQPLASPFVVKVTDASGNPVVGANVSFTVTAGGGTVNPAVASTNSQGLASTTLTLGSAAGTNTVTVSSGTLTGSLVTFTATAGDGTGSPYDLNGDGVINAADVQIAINQALGLAPCTNGDVNHDGVCNIFDVQLVTLAISSAAPSGTSSAAPSGTSATFVKTDTTTAGSWIGTYGADGYTIVGDLSTIPAYAAVTPSGNLSFTWAASTNDTRALQKASSPTDRLAACWYSGTSFNIDVNLSDSNTHQVSLYVVNWDSTRSERIDVLDSANNVLDSRTVPSFSSGQYLVWNVTGHVVFRITNLSGSLNAVVSGLFFR